jgi:hypothetical protein
MRPATDFTRILDEKLAAEGFAAASRRVFDGPRTDSWRPGPRPVFLFGDLRSGFTAGPARPATVLGASTWTSVYGAGPEAPPRPAPRLRRLTAIQRQAVEALRTLGADSLTADYSDAELKSAFRALARKLHPDRHPSSSDAERARLSRAFSSACDAYRTLTNTVH